MIIDKDLDAEFNVTDWTTGERTNHLGERLSDHLVNRKPENITAARKPLKVKNKNG